MKRGLTAGLVGLALLVGLGFACAAGGAEDAAKPLVVPADTAIVDVQLPSGAKVIVDGAESSKTRFTYRPIAKEQTRREEVRVRFRDGKEITRSVLLRGGWHVRTSPPAMSWPGSSASMLDATGWSSPPKVSSMSPPTDTSLSATASAPV